MYVQYKCVPCASLLDESPLITQAFCDSISNISMISTWYYNIVTPEKNKITIYITCYLRTFYIHDILYEQGSSDH